MAYSGHWKTRGCAPFAFGSSFQPTHGGRRVGLWPIPFNTLNETLLKLLHELRCMHWVMKHGAGVSEDCIDELEHPDHEDDDL